MRDFLYFELTVAVLTKHYMMLTAAGKKRGLSQDTVIPDTNEFSK